MALDTCRELVETEAIDWSEFERLVIEHRVVSIVYDTLIQIGVADAIGSETWQRFSDLNRSLQLRQLSKVQELLEITRAFDAEKIRFLTLKGPAVSQFLYGEAAKRHCNDLDFVVLRSDFPKVPVVLNGLGYERGGEAFDRRIEDGEAFEGLSHHEHYCRLGSQVEVHWRVSSLDFMYSDSIDVLYSRRNFVQIGGCSVPLLGEVDLIDYLTLHGTAHCWHRLKWLYDIEMAKNIETQALGQTGLARAKGVRDRLRFLLFFDAQSDVSLPASNLKCRMLAKQSIAQIVNYKRGPDSPSKVLGRTLLVFFCAIGLRNKLGYLVNLFSWPSFYERFPLPRRLKFLYCILGPFYWVYRKIVDRFVDSGVSSR